MRFALAWIAFALILPGLAAAQSSVSAILEAEDLVEVRSSVPGRIASMDVDDGAAIAEGTLLATIDAKVQRARVALAEVVSTSSGALERADIVIQQAEEMRRRVANARRKGAAQRWEVTQSEQAVALARADRKVAQDAMARNTAQLDLEIATLAEFSMHAPFDGTVLQVFVSPGEIVDTSKTILEIANLARLRATAFVPVEWLDRLEVGAELTATLETGGSGRVPAIVDSIDPRLDPASQSVRVTLKIDNADGRFLMGSAISIEQP